MSALLVLRTQASGWVPRKGRSQIMPTEKSSQDDFTKASKTVQKQIAETEKKSAMRHVRSRKSSSKPLRK